MLLVGAGKMAKEYVKVFQSLGIDIDIVGRSALKSRVFEDEMKVKVHSGGLESFLINSEHVHDKAVVAVNVEQLVQCTVQLLEAGVRSILVEKPAALNKEDVARVSALASSKNAQVYVAYNRRYFESVLALRQHIESDGGVRSFHFEFTEWSHLIEKLDESPDLLNKWLLANSTHVIDLAFYLGGKHKTLSCVQARPVSWHPAGSIFTGCGTSETDALFSYMANWGSAGRWSVEIMTDKGRYKLCPLETLEFQERGALVYKLLSSNESNATGLKPGLRKMVEDFSFFTPTLPCISEQAQMFNTYYEIAGYG